MSDELTGAMYKLYQVLYTPLDFIDKDRLEYALINE